jgi:hypothetical protein
MKERRGLVEQTPSIHVREVREAGILPGTECVMVCAGDRFAERLRLMWRNTPFGGQRAYFQCPRCFKGAEILYSTTFFACRACHNLAYRIENLTPLWRKSKKLRKLQKRAGADISRLPCRVPPKPKWQRWHTYLNLRQKVQHADHAFAAAYMRSRHGAMLRGRIAV